jgi:hypothetical protein
VIAVRDDDTTPFDLATGEKVDVPAPEQEPPKPVSNLDSDYAVETHRKLTAFLAHELDRQRRSRRQMAIDEEYRDHEQYTPEEIEILNERGQEPALQNEIKAIMDWVIGTERKTKIDYKVLPREDSDVEPAAAKTKLMKYLSDANKEPMERSLAFKEASTGGLSWLIPRVRSENEDGDEPVFTEYETWRNVIYDSYSRKQDYSDARYWFRQRFVDEDVAIKHFPGREHVIQMSRVDSTWGGGNNENAGWFLGQHFGELLSDTDEQHDVYAAMTPIEGARRARVHLIEAWWRDAEECDVITTPGPFRGQYIHKDDGGMRQIVNMLKLKTAKKVTMRTKVAIMTHHGMLMMSDSPYRHNRIPAVPVICYRKSNDGTFYGVVRGLRSMQDSINKRRSKSNWLLSTNQLIVSRGSYSDEELEELQENAAAPDGVLEVANADKHFSLRRDAALAQQLENFAIQDKMYMRESAGVTSENMGLQSNATSGVAVQARQSQGQVVTSEIFDNYAYALQVVGEMQLCNIEQFMTDRKQFRLLNDRSSAEFTTVNEYDEESGKMTNPIYETRADFAVSMEDFRESRRQAAMAEMTQLLQVVGQTSPDMLVRLLDLVVDSSDVAGKDEWVKRIRALNNQSDPDEKLTPEQAAERQAKAQEIQQQQQVAAEMQALELQTVAAKLDKLVAETEKQRAQTAQHEADTTKRTLEAFMQALQTAGIVQANPALGQIAAPLMESADVKGGEEPLQVPTQGVAPAETNPMASAPMNEEEGMLQ